MRRDRSVEVGLPPREEHWDPGGQQPGPQFPVAGKDPGRQPAAEFHERVVPHRGCWRHLESSSELSGRARIRIPAFGDPLELPQNG